MLSSRFLIVAGGVLAIGWITPASSHVALETSRPVVTSTVCSGVELHLQPGVIGARHYPHAPSARNLPLDPVVLAVPVYPDARRSNLLAKSPPGSGLPVTPYIKTGTAEYSVAAPTGSVESWYQSTFARCGYLSYIYGRDNNGAKRTDFRDFQNPSLQQGHVALSYQATAGGSTIVQYYAWAITLPHRPARSLIPAGRVGSMRVTYYPPELLRRPLRKETPVRVVITDPILIEDVASAVNRLPMSERGLQAECGLQLTPADFVRFELRGGKSTGVTVDDCGLVVMRTASLTDVNGAAGNALGFAVYKWLYSHPHGNER
jgi:hypothetical protein